MTRDPIWQAFAQTGDPLYYLLYRSAQESKRQKSGEALPETQAVQVRG